MPGDALNPTIDNLELGDERAGRRPAELHQADHITAFEGRRGLFVGRDTHGCLARRLATSRVRGVS